MENTAFQPDGVEAYYSGNKDSTTEHQPTLVKGRKWDYSYMRQILCAVIISSGLYIVAFMIGSTSMLPGLLNSHSSPNANYSAEDLKWLASAPIIAAIPANLLGFYLANLMGPTYLLRGSLMLSFLFYNLPVVLPTIATIWISRVVLFILTSMFDIICVPLITELSEPRIRGTNGGLVDLTTSFGILFVFVNFSFLSGRIAILCCSIPVFLGFIGSFFVPQSPYWLIQRGRKSEAAQSFARVLGPSKMERVDELLQDTISSFEKNKEKSSKMHQMKLLLKRKNWKPLLLSTALFGFRELGGHNVVFFYALQIFREADIDIDAFLCTIIIGVVRVGSTFISSLFQDKIGRRPTLIGSIFVSSLCLFIAGLTSHYPSLAMKVVPLIAIVCLILMTGIGLGPLPFTLLGELTPSEVKFSSTAVVYCMFNFFQFGMVNTVPVMLRLFGLGPLFLGFSAVNFIAAILVYFILPETKYKTLTELEELFT